MEDTVTIPIPKKVVGRSTGIRNTNHVNACDNKVRFSPYDTDLVDRAALICDVTTSKGKINRSAFIRWCAVYVAAKILEEHVDEAIDESTEDYIF